MASDNKQDNSNHLGQVHKIDSFSIYGVNNMLETILVRSTNFLVLALKIRE